MKLTVRFKGGSGSGNFGHRGRPGHIGGSADDDSAPGPERFVVPERSGISNLSVNLEDASFATVPADVKRFALNAQDDGWTLSSPVGGEREVGIFNLTKKSRVSSSTVKMRYNPGMGLSGSWTVNLPRFGADTMFYRRFLRTDDAFKYARRLVRER